MKKQATENPNRRVFLAGASTTLAAAQLAASTSTSLYAQGDAAESHKRVVVGVMGLSRGKQLAEDLVKMPGVEIKYACDADSTRAASGAKLVADAGGSAKAIQDYRVMLDDPEVDAFFCAAPNHWHGPAAIFGTQAGKHVYVEKPACHNPQEGEWMVAAAAKYKKCVQVGNQRRSSPGFQAAIAKVHGGAIGDVYLARSFFNRMRGSIGTKTDAPPPATLDYELWQGPVPRRAYRENVVHYNWHWFWHWGNGELGNNGVHALDICRWGLKESYPIKATGSGGRFFYKDDQETPDTQTAAWLFESGKQITYQGISCSHHATGPFVSFYGSTGYIEINEEGGFKIYDDKNKLVEEGKNTGWGQAQHIANFIDAVRKNEPALLNQPILSGHQSTLLCHLGNMAFRSEQVIKSSATDGRLIDPSIAKEYWGREYDPRWEKQMVVA